MTCPDDEELAQLASGHALEPAHRTELVVHLDVCESCRVLVGAFARQSAFLARAASAVHPLGPGARLGGYLIIRSLGQGAMGHVFVGYDGDLDRQVAIKVLTGAAGRGLRAEAAALARLSHPNVVTVYEIEETGPVPFIAMEYVDGLNLGEWLATRARPEAEVVAALLAVADGLAAVHARGLVHRDVKPENVLVGRDGRVRLSDFGLAACAPVEPGEIAGTPAYMAPEQRAGARVDASADQVGFATMAWEALTGHRPEPGAGSPPAARIAAVLQRALTPDVAQRFASMTDLREALRAAARPVRRRWPWLAAAVLLVVAGMAFGVATSGEDPCRLVAEDTGWDLGARVALQQRFASRPRVFATSAATVPAALDGYARDWRAARIRTCHAARAHPGGEVRQAAITRCLDERRAEVVATVRVLGEGDLDVLLRAWEVVAGLRPLSSCEVAAQPALSPAGRAQRATTTAQLARAAALERAGANAAAGTLAQAITSDASGDDLVTEHQLLVARLADRRGAAEEARHALDRAAAAAEGSDQRPLRARVLAARLQHEVSRTDNLGAAALAAALLEGVEQRLADHPDGRASVLLALAAYRGMVGEYQRADAELARAELLALPAWTRAQLAAARCTSLRQAGQLADAVARCAASVEQVRALVGDGHPALATAQANAAGALDASGQRALAAAKLAEAVAILEASLGADHLTTLTAKRNLAGILVSLGRSAEAVPVMEAVLAAYQRQFGDRSSKVAALLVDLAASFETLGKLDRAAALGARATALLRALYPDGHPDLAMAMLGEAELALARGDDAGAERQASAALAMFEKTLGPKHERLVHVLYLFVQLAERRGDRAAARRGLRRALALEQLASDVELNLATELARALEPRSPERLQLVERALGLLAKTGDDPARRAELEQLRR